MQIVQIGSTKEIQYLQRDKDKSSDTMYRNCYRPNRIKNALNTLNTTYTPNPSITTVATVRNFTSDDSSGEGGSDRGKRGERGEGAFDRFLQRRGSPSTPGNNKNADKKGKESYYTRPSNDNTRTIRVSGMGTDHYKPQKGIRKENIAKKMFDPASEGKLQKKHKEGIPKLLGRKGKSMTAVHDATPGLFMNNNIEGVLEDEEEDFAFPYGDDDFEGDEWASSFSSSSSTAPQNTTLSIKKMSTNPTSQDTPANKKYQTIIKNGKKFTYNPNHYPQDILSFEDESINDAPTYTLTDEMNSNEVLPLPSHGDTVDDFVAADMSNPTKYSYVYRPAMHIESRREPKPFHYDRHNPSKEFLDQHKAFLYIFGLQPPPSQSSVADEKELLQHYAKILDEDVEHMFLSSKTSVFLGLNAKNNAKRTLKRLHRMAVSNPISMSIYQLNDDQQNEGDGTEETKNTNESLQPFLSSTADIKSILQITGIQLNEETKPQELLELYFPPNTYHSKLYENITNNDLYLLPSESTILVRLSTAKHATSLATSQSFTARMSKLNQSVIQVYPASREKIFDTFTGVGYNEPVYKKGDKLVVLGDMPLQPTFYSSHEAVVMVDSLPLDITKQALTQLLQPYSEMTRDANGSIQFITCPYGHPTGRAFIGFDLPGEAESFLSTEFSIKDHAINKQLLHDKQLYRRMTRHTNKEGRHMLIKGKRIPPRPNRNEEEILDSLHNWEKHCDKNQLQDLVDCGVDEDHLDSVFMSARCENRSFGAFDLARQPE